MILWKCDAWNHQNRPSNGKVMLIYQNVLLMLHLVTDGLNHVHQGGFGAIISGKKEGAQYDEGKV
jgi:hypothetical protein